MPNVTIKSPPAKKPPTFTDLHVGDLFYFPTFPKEVHIRLPQGASLELEKTNIYKPHYSSEVIKIPPSTIVHLSNKE